MLPFGNVRAIAGREAGATLEGNVERRLGEGGRESTLAYAIRYDIERVVEDGFRLALGESERERRARESVLRSKLAAKAVARARLQAATTAYLDK